MAIESVTADSGSGGASFATDEISSSVQVPYVKLMSGADAAEDLIGGDATNGLDVDVTRVSGTVAVSNAGLTALNGAISGSEVQVDLVSANVTNAGTFAVQVDGSALTALQLIDDAVHADDAAFTLGTSKGVVIMGFAGTQSVNANDAAALACETDGSLHIHDGGNSITVDGTVAVTGVSTAANQTTIIGHLDGVEGLLTTIDGDTGNIATAVQLLDDTVIAQDGDASSAKVVMVGAIRDDSLSTLTPVEGDAVPLRVSSTGALHVTGGGGGTQYAVDDALGATPTGSLALGIRDDALSTLTPVEGDAIGLRVNSEGALWVAAQAGDAQLVDDAAFTPATTSVVMVGFEADEASIDSVDEGDAGAARMTLDRKVIVTPQPHTAGGCTPFYNIDVDESEDAIKASAGQLYELYLFNTTNAIVYVKLYNATTANVTVGTTTPVMTIPVPGNNDTDGAGVVRNWPLGIAFDTAITIAATTGAADNDTGAPGANAIIASGAYK